MENQNIQSEPTDYLSWYSESIRFEPQMLKEEIAEHVQKWQTTNPSLAAEFQKILETEQDPKSQEHILKAHRAIMQTAFLLSGAFSVEEEDAWKLFQEKLLSSSKEDDKYAREIRMELLLGSDQDARGDIRALIRQEVVDQKERRKALIRFDIRIDSFIDEYKKINKS